jgi:hemoglobin
MKITQILACIAIFLGSSSLQAKDKPKHAAGKKPNAAEQKTTTAPKTLYDRLGGMPAITAVVEDFVGNCAGDARIKNFFVATAADPARLTTFKKLVAEQVCQGSGGPCKYSGKSMKETHLKMAIQDAHFTAVVEDLVKSLNKFKVAKADQDALLAILGPMKGDIVTAAKH